MIENTKILVVEDEILIAQFLMMVIEDSGYQVCGYSPSGEEAIQKAVKEQPDLILMDINLCSQMDGIEAANKISEAIEVPIVFMTGYLQTNIEQRIKKVNYQGYLKKPIEATDLQSFLDKFFDSFG